MKHLFFSLITVFAISAVTNAAQPQTSKSLSQKICDSFQTKIAAECAHIMCDDEVANGTYQDLDDCTSASDYAEAAQGGCDSQPTKMVDLTKNYNKKHPIAKITCE